MPPWVDLPLSAKGDKKSHKDKHKHLDTKMQRLVNGHTLSASNLYGKHEASNKQQFTHWLIDWYELMKLDEVDKGFWQKDWIWEVSY